MTPDEKTVQRFYEALQRFDAADASECYRDDAKFEDLAFQLSGKADISAMWRLVCSKKVKIEFGDVRTEDGEVKAWWIADYMFRGKRHVRYKIQPTFAFRDGKILRHVDSASRWEWAKQALGYPEAVLVTACPPILRAKARKELDEFIANEKKAAR
ncbi:nuclear transport factor 2 family protein [Planctomyces sp. SH-PL62]|uniref:nuclear transport factor 2 family protein n=1 Tax=Planctomyces sp. SH-PL62 TaxID=1636152 RepID=UPI00078D8632|nr:nuclear transport factor 2 family protein [Planctomyces sp. SH-PL62]AMV37601.1 SnoaL-like domain protein [Planctomyces sp. SH-PL62]